MTTDIEQVLLDQLKELRNDVKALHTPINCPIEKRIRQLENGENYRRGVIVAIGTGVSLVVNILLIWISKVVK